MAFRKSKQCLTEHRCVPTKHYRADNEVEQMKDENQKFDGSSNEDDWEVSDFLSSDDSCDEWLP